MKVDRDPSGADSKDGDLLRIATQVSDVVLDPTESQILVLKA